MRLDSCDNMMRNKLVNINNETLIKIFQLLTFNIILRIGLFREGNIMPLIFPKNAVQNRRNCKKNVRTTQKEMMKYKISGRE